MHTREWALVIFTLLAQLSIGMLLVTVIVRAWTAGKSGAGETTNSTDAHFYVVAVIMALALVASLFHLEKISHVIGAVPNLSTSWMSREVVATVVFMGFTALLAFLTWRKLGTESLRTALAWLSVLIGLGVLVAMSSTYMLPAQPAWNTWATPAMFATTTLLLGVLGTVVTFTFVRVTFDSRIIKSLAIASVVLMGLELLIMPVYLAFLSTQGAAALQSLNTMVGVYGWALVLRLLLVFVGGGLLAAYLFRNASVSEQGRKLAALAFSAFVLVLAGELIGRFLFYASSHRIGV